MTIFNLLLIYTDAAHFLHIRISVHDLENTILLQGLHAVYHGALENLLGGGLLFNH